MGLIFRKNLLLGILAALAMLFIVQSASGAVFINEFLPNSANTNHEWIEIYNNGTIAVDLNDYNISETGASQNFTISGISIAASGFAVLARNSTLFNYTYSNKSGLIVIEYGPIVPSLNLNDGGDSIYLYNASGGLIDSILNYANPGENVSIGRYPDGNSSIVNLAIQTPGEENDNEVPVLNEWIRPAANSTVKGAINITANITDVTSSVDSALVNFNGSNYSMANYGDIWYFVWNTALNADGRYNITAYFNDSFGFRGVSVLANVSVDNLGPSIQSFNGAVRNGSSLKPGLYTINVTIADIASLVDKVNFSISNNSGILANFSPSKSGNYYTSQLSAAAFGDGSYNLTVNANDTQGNSNSAAISFNIDSAAPSRAVIKPAGNSFVNTRTPEVAFNITDALSGVNSSSIVFKYNFSLLPAVFSVNNVVKTAIPNGLEVNGTITDFGSEGTVYLFADGKDNAGNAVQQLVWSFTIDLKNPKVNAILVNDSDKKLRQGSSLSIRVNASDASSGVSSINVSGGNNLSMGLSGGLWFVNTTPAALGCAANGVCSLSFTVLDNAGNRNNSERLNITADSANPKVTGFSVNDADLTVQTTQQIQINVSINDANFDSGSTVTIGNSTVLVMSRVNSSLYALTTTSNALGCGTNGACSINAVATDIAGNVNNSESITITVQGRKPHSAPIPKINWTKDSNTTINLSLYFTDPDGDKLNYTSSSPNNITAMINNNTGVATLASSANFYGVRNITFNATDGIYANGSSLVILNVTFANTRAPAVLAIPNIGFDEDAHNASVNLSKYVTDEDTALSAITWTAVGNSNVVIKINQTTKIMNVTAPADFNGAESNIILIANDGEFSDSSNPITVTVRAVNDAPAAPVLSTPANGANVLFKSVKLNWSASTDAESGSITYFVYFSNHTNPKFNRSTTSRNITITNLTKGKTYRWLVVAGDGMENSSNSSKFSFLATPNNAPVNNATIPNVAMSEDTVHSSLNLKAYFRDPDSDALTFSSTTPSNVGVSINSGTGAVTLTPSANFNGTNTVTFRASDSVNITSSNTVTITVSNVNDAPAISSFSPASNTTIAESAGSQQFSVSVSDVDTGDTAAIAWFRNETSIGSGTSVTVSGLAKGRYNITAIATDGSGAKARREWKLAVTNQLNSTGLTSNITNLNSSQLEAVKNVVINSSANGGINFGGNTLNFSGITQLESAINISKGVVAIDTANFPGLNKSASLVMKGLNFIKTPLIFMASGFKASGGAACPSNICSNIRYNRTNGKLSFSVAHFTAFFAQTNTTNGAPIITSAAKTSATLRESYSYDVNADDPDGNPLAYSLLKFPSGMGISSSSGLISWQPVSSQLGAHNVTVLVSDGILTDNQSFQVRVSEGPRLAITDLDVKVDGKSDKNVANNTRVSEEVSPGSDVEFEIEVSNLFTNAEDLDIEDIKVEVIIEDIDDGDDFEEEASEFDLSADDEDTISISFDIPYKITEGDYDVIIRAEGEDENNTKHEARWEVLLEVDKEKHELYINKLSVSPSSVSCTRAVSLSTEILNLGRDEEDEVAVEIVGSELGLDFRQENIELDEGSDDIEYQKSLTFMVPETVGKGIYPIAVNAYYDDTKLSDSRVFELTVQDCERISEAKEAVKSPSQPVEVVRPPVTEPEAVPATSITFMESNGYLIFLAANFVLASGLVAALVTMLMMRKR